MASTTSIWIHTAMLPSEIHKTIDSCLNIGLIYKFKDDCVNLQAKTGQTLLIPVLR